MRYLTVLVYPEEDGVFHPLGKQLEEEPSITREAIHHVELLADGTVLLFAEGSGDRERYKAIMSNSSYVSDYLVSGTESGGNRWMAVSQFEPTDMTRQALERQRESDIVIEMPIRIDSDGAFHITYLGSDADFQELFREVAGDASYRFEVIETGDYEPDKASFTRLLTTRQQEVLEAAVEVGYYNAPRQSTLEEIAEVVGIAPSTAGEHLRKVEEQVFSTLVR